MTHGYHSYNVCVRTVWWCNNCTVLGTPKEAAKEKTRGGGEEKHLKTSLSKTEKPVHSILLSFPPVPPTDDKVQQHYASRRPLCTVSPFTKKCTITDMVVLGRERCISILGTATLK